MSNLSIYSGGGFGQVDRGLVRRMDNALQTVEAKAAVTHAVNNARASLTASAMNNIGNLASLGEQIVKTSPAAAPYLDMALRSYAVVAAQAIGEFR